MLNHSYVDILHHTQTKLSENLLTLIRSIIAQSATHDRLSQLILS
jgi:hypothetical protein